MIRERTECITQLDWQALLKCLQERLCVLLLGPQVAVDPNAPEGDPLSVRLAKNLADELRQQGNGGNIVSDSDLAHVAQIYQAKNGKGHVGLELAVGKFYKPYENLTTQLHNDLAALPFSLCVSTTPERFLLNAFKRTKGKRPIYDFYHFKPSSNRSRQRMPELSRLSDQQPNEEHPLIYDLYGSLGETVSLVLTENDLLDFLVSVTRVSAQTPQSALHWYLLEQLRDPSVSFLFLGFGFRHWYVRVLLHALTTGSHRAPSLALEREDFFGGDDFRQTAFFFQSGHMLEFRQLPQDFAAQLRLRFETITREENGEEKDQPPEDAPIVFLCHENRDKWEAEKIGKALETRGIRIWLDKQNLRAGERWPTLIADVLDKQCNYVVVVQSPRMLDKTEGYFRHEIELALTRQKRFFESGSLFVIPVLLEQHPDLPLKIFHDLHWTDLTQSFEIEIDRLARTITDDFRQRK